MKQDYTTLTQGTFWGALFEDELCESFRFDLLCINLIKVTQALCVRITRGRREPLPINLRR